MFIQTLIRSYPQLHRKGTSSHTRLLFAHQYRNLSTTIMEESPQPTTEQEMQQINEGTAKMLYDTKEKVFYNKVQVLNRDLSIQVIKLFAEKIIAERNERYQTKFSKYEELSKEPSKVKGKHNELREPKKPREGITILDALSASGLRSIRYVKEIPQAEHVTINDLSIEATKLARDNCIRNEVPLEKVRINNQDATMLMYENRDPLNQFDVIDLDPYGTVVPFLDAAVQSVSDGGLLCVTCTDMTVLGGKYPEVAYYKYNSMPVRGRYLHEMSLRMLLHTIDMTANKYKRHIVPWISMSIDYYVRVFVRVFDSAVDVKNACIKRVNLYQCNDCPAYALHTIGQFNPKNSNYNAATLHLPTVCPQCGGTYRVGGPYYSDPIHQQDVLDTLLQRVKESSEVIEHNPYPVQTKKRLIGLLTVMSEELKDVPFFYSLPELASAVLSSVPTNQEFAAALTNLGYHMSQFHHEASAMKTDAPHDVIWDIIRSYCKLHPPTGNHMDKKGVHHSNAEIAKRILAKEIKTEADFTVHHHVRKADKTVARFPLNPEAHWGPKRKAGIVLAEDAEKQRVKVAKGEEEAQEQAGTEGKEPVEELTK